MEPHLDLWLPSLSYCFPYPRRPCPYLPAPLGGNGLEQSGVCSQPSKVAFRAKLGNQGPSGQPRPGSSQDLGLGGWPPRSGTGAEQGLSPRDGREPPGKQWL